MISQPWRVLMGKYIRVAKLRSRTFTKPCALLIHIGLLLLGFISQHPCLCEPVLGQIYNMKETQTDKTCIVDDVERSFSAQSDISCVYSCSSQLQSVGIFYNEDNGVCVCCAKLYTGTEDLPVDVGTKYYINETYDGPYIDCVHAQADGIIASGVQMVKTPLTNTTIEVYCDMETRGGGWLVFQNRFDGSVDFLRNFLDYEEGFGNADGEYWLGLKYLHELTVHNPSMLYVTLVDANDVMVYELFTGFYLDAGPGYAFHIGDYLEANDTSVPPGYDDSFATTREVDFTTIDRDNDGQLDENCAVRLQAGWWYYQCTKMNPNGPYITPGTLGIKESITHRPWKDLEALKATRIMIKRP